MCEAWVIDFGTWFSGMTSNAVGGLAAIAIAYAIGAHVLIHSLNDRRTAGAVRVDGEWMVGPSSGRNVTVFNASSQTITNVTGAWKNAGGITHQQAFPVSRLVPNQETSGPVGNYRYEHVVWIGVTFEVAGGGRTYVRDVHPGRSLRRYYPAVWGRWNFIRHIPGWLRWRLWSPVRRLARRLRGLPPY